MLTNVTATKLLEEGQQGMLPELRRQRYGERGVQEVLAGVLWAALSDLHCDVSISSVSLSLLSRSHLHAVTAV